MVKEALHKYRAMCMQSNVASLEEVVRLLVDLAEKRTEDARNLVDETILEGAEDLEDGAMETPETLLLESAGHALTKERIDRQQVVPWMRFLWEVYRVVLDIVKSHSKLELCYHNMASKAFSFCIKYKRFMEFRRLCDMLRQHLSQLMNNLRSSPNDVKITDPETLQKFLETRFTQLSTAVTLEHWQQAYRTIEDIHMLMAMGKAKVRPQHMSIYYEKIMQVFWVSGNYLYHAHALYKLYTLSIKQNRNLSAEDAQNMASRLLLAALSIPVYDAQSAVLSDSYGILTEVLGTPTNDNASRHARMASLLGYSSAAERAPLISELRLKGVLNASHSELHDLYDLLEGEMAPLKFSERFSKVLKFVETQDVLKDYITPLRRVGIFRLLEQLGKVYDVMRLSDMKKVASFTDYAEVEETALTALKTRSLAVRFDYQNQCLRFESELFSTDGMRTQLGRLAKRMALTSKMLTDNALLYRATATDNEIVAESLERKKKADARRQAAVSKAKTGAEVEESNVLRRRDIIERRKEEAERRTAEAVKQKKLAAARELALAERRKQEEAKRRLEEQQKLIRVSKESAAGAGSANRTSGVIGAEEIEGDAEREARMTREKEEELKEQAEFKKRALQLAAHLNHMERALREEQWDILKENHVKENENLKKLVAEVGQKELDDAKAHHQRALEDKGRTTQIMPYLTKYIADLTGRVDAEFDLWAQKERERAEAQAARAAEMARLRREEEERARKAMEEEERLEREEAERLEQEEREAREEQERKEAEAKRLEEEREREARETREREARAAAEKAEQEKAAALAASSAAAAAAAAAAAPKEKYKPGGFGKSKIRSKPPPSVAGSGANATGATGITAATGVAAITASAGANGVGAGRIGTRPSSGRAGPPGPGTRDRPSSGNFGDNRSGSFRRPSSTESGGSGISRENSEVSRGAGSEGKGVYRAPHARSSMGRSGFGSSDGRGEKPGFSRESSSSSNFSSGTAESARRSRPLLNLKDPKSRQGNS